MVLIKHRAEDEEAVFWSVKADVLETRDRPFIKSGRYPLAPVRALLYDQSPDTDQRGISGEVLIDYTALHESKENPVWIRSDAVICAADYSKAYNGYVIVVRGDTSVKDGIYIESKSKAITGKVIVASPPVRRKFGPDDQAFDLYPGDTVYFRSGWRIHSKIHEEHDIIAVKRSDIYAVQSRRDW